MRRIDPDVPLLKVTTQSEQIEARFAQEKVFAQACALFGGLAVLIASIGLFGLMSANVARRTNARSGFAWRSARIAAPWSGWSCAKRCG